MKRQYEDLKRTTSVYQEIVTHLSTSNDVTGTTRRQLQSVSDPAALLQTLRGQPEASSSMGMLPGIQSYAEFNLAVNHPTSFPLLGRSADMSIAQHPPTNLPGERSTAGNAIAGTSSTPQNTLPESSKGKGAAPPGDGRPGGQPLQPTNALIPPYSSSLSESVPICDERLAQLDIRYWTRVPISNQDAAKVISLYLQNDQPILGLFDADLFLSDLIAKKFEFCSPFLVSSLLAWACVSLMSIAVI